MSVQAIRAEGGTLFPWVPIVEHFEPDGSRTHPRAIYLSASHTGALTVFYLSLWDWHW